MTAAAAIVSKAFVEAHPKDLGQPGVGIVCTGRSSLQVGSVARTSSSSASTATGTRTGSEGREGHVQVVEDESTLIAGLNTVPSTEPCTRWTAGWRRESPDRSGSGEVASSLVAGLLFNTQRKPWSDARVRRAFAMALDIPGIVKAAYNGYGRATKSPAPPIMFTYAKQQYEKAYRALPRTNVTLLPRRPDQDRRCRRSAGTLMISTPTDKLVRCDRSANRAQDLGSSSHCKPFPSRRRPRSSIHPGARKYDLDLFSALGDTSDPIGFLYIQFASAAPISNVSQYKNAVVDKNLNA